jgi:uncharacterized coiled-coil protein SlyX
MNNDEEVLATLKQMLELQRQALANQQRAIAQQQVAIERQAVHLRLYKIALVALAPVIAYLVYVFVGLPRPH